MPDFLSKDTAGLPNWAWLLIIGAGIAAAYIVPKIFGSITGSGSTTSTDSGTPASNLGLAVDPSTGLPYAVEGLVPSGAYAGQGGSGVDLTSLDNLMNEIQQYLNQSGGTTPGTGSGGGSGPSRAPGMIYQNPSSGVWHYISTGNQTLSQIASSLGLSSWNDLYAIPENQAAFGKLSAAQAANYKPQTGVYVVIPGATGQKLGQGATVS